MKQLYYVFLSLLRGKGNNLIKIISLSAGLLVGLVLFARVAFERSFDTYYPEADRLYTIMCNYTIGGEARDPSAFLHAPMPSDMNDELPEIAFATVVRAHGKQPFFNSEQKFEPETVYADSLFFKTFGFELIKGDDKLLGIVDNLFLSEKMAKIIFGDEEPVGKVLKHGKNRPYTVQGVFKDIPENSHLKFDAVGSFGNMEKQFGYETSWDSGDSFLGYVRLAPNVIPETVDAKLPAFLRRHQDVDANIERGFEAEYYLYSVTKIHSDDENVKRMLIILSFLATAILFAASMNYVLISISSLAQRAKTVGVHKCNGASSKNIFSMFIYETAILVSVSLIIIVLVLFAFREIIESIANASLGALFSFANLWTSVFVVAVIFFLSAIIPGRIFSSIPVTQVFHSTTSNKIYWKRSLLFIQLTGISFILILLAIIFKQYTTIMDKDLGYNPENIVYVKINGLKGENRDELMHSVAMFKQEFERFSFVEKASTHSFLPTSGYGGSPVTDKDNNWLFTARGSIYDPDYIPTMGISFVAGNNFTGPDQVIVNETFVKKMNWKDNPVGKEVINGGNSYGKIVGVVKDYPISSLYYEQQPILIEYRNASSGYLTLRLSDLNPEYLKELNAKLVDLYPNDDMGFAVLQDRLSQQYVSIRQFRDSVIAAFIVVLLITIMGLFGYVSDEITRRSKEIAIRKINGATTKRILELLCKDITYMSLPAIIIGIMISFLIGRNWLQEFAVKTTLSPGMFIFCGILILMGILLLVTSRTWDVANENPVESIKSE
ncbi:MAG: ABC transporter permease [Tannerella sp.]|jgi:putative ABC transport system permease protein|nr:ABC transporter permease [Tannerella sp.]